MDLLPLAALILSILAPMAAITIGFAMLLSNQIKASEQRINDQIEMTEVRLTEQYRETNRDTKLLIRDVAFLQGSLGIAPRRQDSDTDGSAEAAD